MRPRTLATTVFPFLLFALVGSLPSPDGTLERTERGDAGQCQPDAQHHIAFGRWAVKPNDTHRLSLMSPTLHQHSFRTVTASDGVLAGSTDCPSTPLYSPDEPIMGRSLCPWYWKVNYSPTRVPAMLPEAVCRCRRAVTGINRVVVYECQPLTMHIRVLQLDDDCKQYQERSIEMAVACVSVVQSSMKLNKIAGIEQLGQTQLLQDV